MSRSSYLFGGIFGSFALSCFAMVLVPQMQLGGLQPERSEEYGTIYPLNNVRQGREVYQSQGCFHCHSQQVRDPQYGTDIDRGWASRRTVARDYLYDQPAFLGYQRIGPDLSSVGSSKWRNEEVDDLRKPKRRDAAWHYHHLYSPRSIVTESLMPPFRFLFTERKISGEQSADALQLTGKDAPKEGYEIVPKAEARALVAYLLSLDRNHPLPEAKVPAASAVPAAQESATK
jgi:cytochrome c oxidase cbb3-type subunit 2